MSIGWAKVGLSGAFSSVKTGFHCLFVHLRLDVALTNAALIACAAFSTSLRVWQAEIEIRIDGLGKNNSWCSTYFARVIKMPSLVATYSDKNSGVSHPSTLLMHSRGASRICSTRTSSTISWSRYFSSSLEVTPAASSALLGSRRCKIGDPASELISIA